MKIFCCILVFMVLAACQTVNNPHRPVYVIKVRAGDTLASIAGRYGTTWWQIVADNQINNYHRIKVGDTLRVRPGPGGIIAEGAQAKDSGFLGLAVPFADPPPTNKADDVLKNKKESKSRIFLPTHQSSIQWSTVGHI